MANPYGDVELDAHGMRALAHPVRLALLTRLQQGGPSTATRLAEGVGASPSVTSWHLRQLAAHGLVRDADDADGLRQHGRERWWQAASRGFRFGGEVTEEGAAANRALEEVIASVEGDQVGRWRMQAEPLLDPAWRTRAGRSNTVVLITGEELDAVQEAIQDLLAPFVLRKDAAPDTWPAGTRAVRLLHHTLPDAEDAEDTGNAGNAGGAWGR